jgi:hypothetical protein
MAEKCDKLICPNCKKQELRYENGHYECTDCGNVIVEYGNDIVDRAKPFSVNKILFLLKLCLRLPYILIYLAPAIVYILILLATCFFLLSETWNLLAEPSIKTTDQILGTLILFILISMALMDLTSLIFRQYIYPSWDKILLAYQFETFDVPYPVIPEERLESEDKRYIIKVLTLAVIFILMHIFYEFFTGKDSIEYAVLIVGSLLGCAVMLIAIKFYKK